MSKRERLASVLDRTGVLAGVLGLRRRLPSPWLTVLTYHSVRRLEVAQRFDPGVIDATPEGLDRQIALLKRYFSIIGIDELSAYLEGHALPPNPIVITFDDGYRDCHDQALPVLLRHGVKAVFFIATSYVHDRRVFWWDRISYLLNRATRRQLQLSYPQPLEVDSAGDLERARRVLLRVVKDQPELDLERFLDEVAAAAGVQWDAALERSLADELVLTWDQVRALVAAGMDVESHTRTHRVLQTLPAHAVAAELAGSRADLERALGRPVRAVAYPVGKDIVGRSALRAAVRDAGYTLGFSNATGVNHLWGRFDPLNVRRFAVELNLSESFFRGILAIPYLAH